MFVSNNICNFYSVAVTEMVLTELAEIPHMRRASTNSACRNVKTMPINWLDGGRE